MNKAYRTDVQLENRQKLELLADQEAEFDQAAKDLEALTKARQTVKEAEARLVAKGIHVTQQEDALEAKKYADELIQNITNTAQEKKEKRKQRMKFAAKLLGATVAVLSVGYGLTKMPLARWYKQEQEIYQRRELAEDVMDHMNSVADIDCNGGVNIKEFYSFYKTATGQDFFNQNLNVDSYFTLEINNKKSIEITYGGERPYIYIPPTIAERLLKTERQQHSCSIKLE